MLSISALRVALFTALTSFRMSLVSLLLAAPSRHVVSRRCPISRVKVSLGGSRRLDVAGAPCDCCLLKVVSIWSQMRVGLAGRLLPLVSFTKDRAFSRETKRFIEKGMPKGYKFKGWGHQLPIAQISTIGRLKLREWSVLPPRVAPRLRTSWVHWAMRM